MHFMIVELQYLAHLYKLYRKSYCTIPGVGIGSLVCMDKMLKFYVKSFYLMGKVLSGELSCIWTGLGEH